jgi:hypothetical protein
VRVIKEILFNYTKYDAYSVRVTGMGVLYMFDTVLDLAPSKSFNHTLSTFLNRTFQLSFMCFLVITLALNVILTCMSLLFNWDKHFIKLS